MPRNEEFYVDGKFSMKLYYAAKKEELKAKGAVKDRCECGAVVRHDKRAIHLRSNKHIRTMAMFEERVANEVLKRLENRALEEVENPV